MDFSVPADHDVKLNETEKNDKYLDLARELKGPWNMKVTAIIIVNDSIIKTGQVTEKKRCGDQRRLFAI